MTPNINRLQRRVTCRVLPGAAVALFLSLCGTAAETTADVGQHSAGVLLLNNSDQFSGTLVAIDPQEQVLTWRHPRSPNPIRFRLNAVEQINLDAAGMDVHTRREKQDIVVLVNGDRLQGKLLNIDRGTVTVENDYAGVVTVKRRMMDRIHFNQDVMPVIYAGSHGLEWWQQPGHRGGWVEDDGAFIARGNAPLGRIFPELPPKCYTAFTMQWEGVLNYSFALYSGKMDQFQDVGYLVHFSRQVVRLSEAGHRRRQPAAFQTPILSSTTVSSPVRVELFTDLEAGSITIAFNNGEAHHSWTDLNTEVERGNGIVFLPQMHTALRISDITIMAWDGEKPEYRTPLARGEKDAVRLLNDDILSGSILSIEDGNIQFDAGFASFGIAQNELAELVFGAEGGAVPAESGGVRANVKGVGTVTLNSLQVREGALSGVGAGVEEISVPLSNLQSLLFVRERDPQS